MKFLGIQRGVIWSMTGNLKWKMSRCAVHPPPLRKILSIWWIASDCRGNTTFGDAALTCLWSNPLGYQLWWVQRKRMVASGYRLQWKQFGFYDLGVLGLYDSVVQSPLANEDTEYTLQTSQENHNTSLGFWSEAILFWAVAVLFLRSCCWLTTAPCSVLWGDQLGT